MYISLGIETKAIEAQRDMIASDNITLQREAMDSRYKANQYDTLQYRVSNIRSNGYSPDTLLVLAIQNNLKKYPSLNWSFINEVAERESSWGYNRKSGTVGEKGWSQIRPETMKYFINLLDGDTTNFNPDDYKDVKTATEWSFAMFYFSKVFRKKNEWTEWNNGRFMQKGRR